MRTDTSCSSLSPTSWPTSHRPATSSALMMTTATASNIRGSFYLSRRERELHTSRDQTPHSAVLFYIEACQDIAGTQIAIRSRLCTYHLDTLEDRIVPCYIGDEIRRDKRNRSNAATTCHQWAERHKFYSETGEFHLRYTRRDMPKAFAQDYVPKAVPVELLRSHHIDPPVSPGRSPLLLSVTRIGDSAREESRQRTPSCRGRRWTNMSLMCVACVVFSSSSRSSTVILVPPYQVIHV